MFLGSTHWFDIVGCHIVQVATRIVLCKGERKKGASFAFISLLLLYTTSLRQASSITGNSG
jgi:hypothetical protein